MEKEYIDIMDYTGEGYHPMIDYGSWRVAVLRYCEELEIQNLFKMQKHQESDEVFVLLAGNCTLFSGGSGNEIGTVEAVAMEPLKLYNVKKGVWHTHTLDKKATVLIVENQNTCDANSPELVMKEDQLTRLAIVFRKVSPTLNYH